MIIDALKEKNVAKRIEPLYCPESLKTEVGYT
jgi:hypothetical protein